MFLPPANEVWGKVIFSQACVKNFCSQGGSTPGVYLLWGCLVWGVPAGGVPGPGVPGADPPRDGYCRARYASYCNAFLFLLDLKRKRANEIIVNLACAETERHQKTKIVEDDRKDLPRSDW